MTRRHIGVLWDRITRNNINENFIDLYKQTSDIVNTLLDEVLETVLNRSTVDFRDSVMNFDELKTKYPNPKEGETVFVIDEGYIYRYSESGNKWIHIYSVDYNIYNEVVEMINQVNDDLQNTKRILNESVKDQNILKDNLINLVEKVGNLEVAIDDLKKRMGNEKTKVKNLKFPLIVPHRGAKNIYQEHTMVSYENQVERGNPILELDVQQTADGGLVVMHDDNYRRTTDFGYSTVKVNELTTNFVTTLKVNDKVGGNSGYELQPVPFLSQVFSRFGQNATYFPESKDRKSARKIVEMAKDYGLEDYIVVQSFNLDELLDIVSEGVQTLYMSNSLTSTDVKEIAESGITYLGCRHTQPESYFNMLKESGLKIFAYTVNRKHEYNRVKSFDVDAIFSDDPFYISDGFVPRKNDRFIEKVFDDGMLPNYTDYRGGFGQYYTPEHRTWGFLDESTVDDGRDFVIQGYLGEMPKEFSLEFEVTNLDKIANSWVSVAVCLQNDYFDDNKNPEKSGGGYHCLFGANSRNLTLYEITSTGATEIARYNYDGDDNDKELKFRVTVGSTGVKWERLDIPYSCEAGNTKYRNGYIAFGRRNVKPMFRNVVVK